MSSTRGWRGCVFIATSLDGYIAREDGDIGWLTDPPQLHGHVRGQPVSGGPKDYEAFMATVDHLVMGRGTYEKVLTFSGWPYSAKQVTSSAARFLLPAMIESPWPARSRKP